MSQSVSSPSLIWSLEYIDAINNEILSAYGSEGSSFDALVREVISSGRRIRAILAILWCEALSGDYRPALPIAAAYEFAHAAALVEDDIIDDSHVKYGSYTVPKKYGIPKSLLVSNFLLFCAPPLIARYSKRELDPEVVAKLLGLLGDCGRLTARGEFLDLEMTRMEEVSESAYLEMTKMKTGALVGASSASGALIGLGKFDPELVEAAYRFGESLGIAYQINDDLRDYFGNEEDTGKVAFCDLKSGKKSLPLIHCLEFAQGDDRDFLKLILTNPDFIEAEGEERVRSILLKYRSDEFCEQSAIRFVRKARDSLSVITSDSVAKDRLFEIIEYLSVKS